MVPAPQPRLPSPISWREPIRRARPSALNAMVMNAVVFLFLARLCERSSYSRKWIGAIIGFVGGKDSFWSDGMGFPGEKEFCSFGFGNGTSCVWISEESVWGSWDISLKWIMNNNNPSCYYLSKSNVYRLYSQQFYACVEILFTIYSWLRKLVTVIRRILFCEHYGYLDNYFV